MLTKTMIAIFLTYKFSTLKKPDVCDCSDCKKGDYHPANFTVSETDFLKLDEERPFGITAHMVVKNEALSIQESVESLVDVADEVIITYQASADATAEILQKLYNRYPDKIRLFHYKPYLPPYGRLATSNALNRYPKTGVHNPANYYNFGLVKCRYKYYLKADGDQVYFTQKLAALKELLQSVEERPGLLKTNIATWFFKKTTSLLKFLAKKHPAYFARFLRWKIYQYLYCTSRYPDFGFSFAGINIHEKNAQVVCGIQPLHFNSGIGDHFLQPLSSKNRYRWSDKYRYEIFSINQLTLAGFAWLHYKFIKRIADDDTGQQIETSIPVRLISTIKDTEQLIKTKKGVRYPAYNSVLENILEQLIYGFWHTEKKYIREDAVSLHKIRTFIEMHTRI